MTRPWRDATLPVAERVAALLDAMTLEEKVAQLSAVWMGVEGDQVAPAQHDFAEPLPPFTELVRPGIGQLTRVFGTAPAEPAVAAKALAAAQRDILAAGRHGVPAIAHEECLSGFTAWRATVFPTPLAWAAAFDPAGVAEMAAAIGTSMHAVGIHLGLAPVADVVRDARWGRVEETAGEDPHLVGEIVTAYVRGLQSAGVLATLKHFAGYSASVGGRNQAPVSIGPREVADVLLPPFERAIREGGAAAVMPSYAEVDGVPPTADRSLLTDLLRDAWGFDGIVVSDYFAVSLLEAAHGVAGTKGEAAARALAAGVDVELPTVRCFGAPLLAEIDAGRVPESLVDRAAERVLRQKCELGLLDEGWEPTPPALYHGGAVDLDPPALRALSRGLAERSVVLLANGRGTLPLASPERLAVVGPCAAEIRSLLGCYAFPNHVGVHHPEVPLGVEIPTLLDAVRQEFPTADVEHVVGVPFDGPADLGAAVAAARSAGLCVLAVGDRSGLFGNGTSGEGCDAEDLTLPGEQAALVEAVLSTGVPTVLVVLSGRPYALGAFVDHAAAIVQAFFPGQEGAAAVAGVLSGRVNPSGRLPVQVPREPGGQPAGYLRSATAGRHSGTSVDPTPLFAFGHGLSYTAFEYADLTLSTGELPATGAVTVGCTVTNVGDRVGTEVVQVYLHDPVASVARPPRLLVGFSRVSLAAGASARVSFEIAAEQAAFTGVDLCRGVEPGEIVLLVGKSSVDTPLCGSVWIHE